MEAILVLALTVGSFFGMMELTKKIESTFEKDKDER
jgi:hypothetical protein